MGGSFDDQIKEVENAAKAQEQQDAQQNAQQAGQATAVNTEESAIIKGLPQGRSLPWKKLYRNSQH